MKSESELISEWFDVIKSADLSIEQNQIDTYNQKVDNIRKEILQHKNALAIFGKAQLMLASAMANFGTKKTLEPSQTFKDDQTLTNNSEVNTTINFKTDPKKEKSNAMLEAERKVLLQRLAELDAADRSDYWDKERDARQEEQDDLEAERLVLAETEAKEQAEILANSKQRLSEAEEHKKVAENTKGNTP